MVSHPTTGRGVLITIGAAAVVFIALYTTGLAPIIIGGIAVTLLLYAVYVLAINVHRWATTRYNRGGQ